MARGQLTVRVLGDTKPFERSVQGIGKTLGTVAKVGATAFAAAGAAAVTGAFKVASFGDEVAKSARQAGVGAEQFQELRFAFGQGGVEAATFDRAAQNLNRRLGESATTGGSADGAFESLGIALKDASGDIRDTGDVMDDVLPKLADIESDAERAAVAGDLFGQRAGPELAAALADGADGIDEARQKAQDLGIVMDGEAAEAAERFTDQWDDIKQSALGLLRDGLTPVMEFMSSTVFPVIQDGIGNLRDLWEVFQDGDGVIGGLQDVFANLFSGDGDGMFSGLLDMAQDAFDNLVDWLVDGGLTSILDAILASRDRLFNAAMELFPALLDAAITFIPQLLNWITGTMIPRLLEFIVGAVPQLLAAGLELFRSLIDAVVQVLPGLLSTLLGEVLPSVLQTILGMIPELLEAAIEAFTALVQAVIEVLPQLLTTLLTEVLPAVIETILDMLPDLLQAAIEAFFSLVLAVVEVLPELLTTLLTEVLPAVIETLLGMIPELLTTAVEVFMALVEAVIDVLPELLRVIAIEVIPAVVSAVLELGGQLFDAGVAAAKGLWEGIKSMAGWLKDKVVGWAADVLPGPIANLLGIASPSKLFAEMGEQSGEGLAKGLEHSRRLVSAASADLARMAESSANVELRGMVQTPGGASAAGAGLVSPGRAASGRIQPIVIVTQIDGRDVARSEAFWDQAQQRLVRESRLSAGAV